MPTYLPVLHQNIVSNGISTDLKTSVNAFIAAMKKQNPRDIYPADENIEAQLTLIQANPYCSLKTVDLKQLKDVLTDPKAIRHRDTVKYLPLDNHHQYQNSFINYSIETQIHLLYQNKMIDSHNQTNRFVDFKQMLHDLANVGYRIYQINLWQLPDYQVKNSQ